MSNFVNIGGCPVNLDQVVDVAFYAAGEPVELNDGLTRGAVRDTVVMTTTAIARRSNVSCSREIIFSDEASVIALREWRESLTKLVPENDDDEKHLAHVRSGGFNTRTSWMRMLDKRRGRESK